MTNWTSLVCDLSVWTKLKTHDPFGSATSGELQLRARPFRIDHEFTDQDIDKFKSDYTLIPDCDWRTNTDAATYFVPFAKMELRCGGLLVDRMVLTILSSTLRISRSFYKG